MRPILLFVLLFMTTMVPGRASELESITVVQVRDHVITSREVQIFSALKLAISLGEKERVNPQKEGLEMSSPDFAVYRNDWAQAWMVFFEAENFGVAEVRSAELRTTMDSVLEALRGWPFCVKAEVSSDELEEFLKVWIRSQRFLGFKRESTAVSVSDSEVKAYFEENRLKFGNLPFKSFEKNIHRFLTEQRLSERIDEWFQVLRRKYNVRQFGTPPVSS